MAPEKAHERSSERETDGEDAEYAAGAEYEEFEKVDWSATAAENGVEEPKAEPIDLVEEAIKFTIEYKEVAERKCPTCTLSYNTNLTGVIPNRSTEKKKAAPKWETMLAALIQAVAIMFPEIFGNASKLYWKAKADNEVVEAQAFLKPHKQHITQEHVDRLHGVLKLWASLIALASRLGSYVFKQGAYDTPFSLTWTEFLGIATTIASYYMEYLGSEEDLEGNGEAWYYDKRQLLQQIDQLRRYFRHKIHSSGARREQYHWKYCYFIIVNKQYLAIGPNSASGKVKGPDPALEMLDDEYDAMIDEIVATGLEKDGGIKDIDVELADIGEGEQDRAEDEAPIPIDPRLLGETGAGAAGNEDTDIVMASTTMAASIQNGGADVDMAGTEETGTVEDEGAVHRDALFFERFGVAADAARKVFGGHIK